MISHLSLWLSDPMVAVLNTLYILPGVLIGLTVHEWAHAFAAYKLGDPTAKNLGRMTLNPASHLDLFGFLSLVLLGFGWAKPVPVTMHNFKHFKRDDLIVSLAGITMNFLVAFFFMISAYVLQAVFEDLSPGFEMVMSGIVSINLSLMAFNLIPIYPLDGAHVLENLCVRRFPRFCMFLRSYGRYIMLALLVFGGFSLILSPIISWFYGWMGDVANAIASLI